MAHVFRALALLLLVGCFDSSAPSGSSGSNWLTCKSDDECLGHGDAVACQSGYCVDALGKRVAASRSADAGSEETGDAAIDAGSWDVGGQVNDAGSRESGEGVSEGDGAAEAGGSAAGDSAAAGDSGRTERIDAGLVEICDGSDEIRLSYTNGGGMVANYYSFFQPYGTYALFVDGQCRYWIFEQPHVGIRTGVLDEQEANDLSTGLRLHWLSEFSGSYGNSGCSDGGTTTISNGVDYVSCYCGCPEAPVPVNEMFFGSSDLLRNLMAGLAARAEPSGGPIRVVVLAATVDDPSSLWAVYDWPLDWSPSEILTEPPEGDVHAIEWTTVGEIVDDPDDIQLLRALGTRVADDVGSFSEPMFVRDADNRYYLLAFRDEIPAELETSIEGFCPDCPRFPGETS